MLCPSPNELERLLDDEPHSSAGAVARHVAECAACQRRLDELTTPQSSQDEILWPDAVARNTELQSLLQRLREQPLTEWSSASHGLAEVPAPVFAGPVSHAAPLGWLGTYQIQRRIGSGATGEVFEARDSRLARSVAIKVLRPQLALNAVSRARFEREGRVIAAIQDEHIAQIFEIGLPIGGTPYLVMEFIGGESLETRLRRSGSFDPREAAEVVRQVACGLEAAHRQGVVHRDVKLSNVLLPANSGRAKIVDFGLARVTESSELLTQEGFLAGTPAYMSPEQLKRPQDADARSDVYSLGVLLYELLTGERPFRGVLRMVLLQVLHEEPLPPRRLNDRIPRDLETICLKAMSKEPMRRYAAARDFAADLQRWLTGQPVQARPLGPVARAWRWCRRNPKWAVLNGVVVLVVVAGAIDWTRYLLPTDPLRHEVAVLREESRRSQQLAERHRLDAEQLTSLLDDERRRSRVRELTILGQLADGLIERQQFDSAETVLTQAVADGGQVFTDLNAMPEDLQTAVILQRNLALVERELGRHEASRQRLQALAATLRRLISDSRFRTNTTLTAWADAQLAEIEAASK